MSIRIVIAVFWRQEQKNGGEGWMSTNGQTFLISCGKTTPWDNMLQLQGILSIYNQWLKRFPQYVVKWER